MASTQVLHIIPLLIEQSHRYSQELVRLVHHDSLKTAKRAYIDFLSRAKILVSRITGTEKYLTADSIAQSVYCGHNTPIVHSAILTAPALHSGLWKVRTQSAKLTAPALQSDM